MPTAAVAPAPGYSLEKSAPTLEAPQSGGAPDLAAPPSTAPAAPSQQIAAVPPASTPAPVPLDSRALAAQGLEKELRGDHEGALKDLRAALAIEPDPERQLGIRNLLQLLDARR